MNRPTRFYLALHATLAVALAGAMALHLAPIPPHWPALAQRPTWTVWVLIGLWLALSATGVPRFEVSVGEPKGATELERVADVAGSPVVFDKDICAVTYQGRVGCFDLATGQPRWTKEVSSDVGVAVDQRFVFTADEKGAVAAFSREGGQSAWKNDKLAFRRLSTPASVGRSVAVGDMQGYIHFLSREDGALIGRVSTDGAAIKSSPGQ
eukprot:gene26055-32584_t